MASGPETLSDKEKQTLRLLVDGHDAKSMARHLGLSVHTINERLRDARRKMDVSSSREAARKLREIEQQTPEPVGYKLFGEADAEIGVRKTPASAWMPRMSRRTGWIAGAVLMSLSLALFALSSLPGNPGMSAAPQSAAVSAPAAESAAVHAARQWLALVDAGDWNGSWDATGQAFKSLNTVERWTAVSQSVRPPLGAVISRTLIGDDFVPAPPYGYQVVKFRTSYANKADAIETLSLALEDGHWRVVGCTIE